MLSGPLFAFLLQSRVIVAFEAGAANEEDGYEEGHAAACNHEVVDVSNPMA